MTDEQKPLLQPTGPESDFRFFKTIEDTIVGTLAFVGHYLFTSWTLLTAPGKIVNYINRSREERFQAGETFHICGCHDSYR